MRLRFVTATETLMDEDIPVNVSAEDREKINQFNKRELVSVTIEYAAGVLAEAGLEMDNLHSHPELIKQLIVEVK